MGVYPESFLAPMRGDIRAIEARLAATKPASDAMLKMGKTVPAGEAKAEGAH
jgi:NADH-quinone oxidoreductase subunit M